MNSKKFVSCCNTKLYWESKKSFPIKCSKCDENLECSKCPDCECVYYGLGDGMSCSCEHTTLLHPHCSKCDLTFESAKHVVKCSKCSRIYDESDFE